MIVPDANLLLGYLSDTGELAGGVASDVRTTRIEVRGIRTGALLRWPTETGSGIPPCSPRSAGDPGFANRDSRCLRGVPLLNGVPPANASRRR